MTANAKQSTPSRNPIPAPDNGAHARSHAAHLGGKVHASTKPTTQARAAGSIHQPPQEISRIGKTRRGE